jgi:CRP/FNR family transcriptional regulator, cyclic AMP receptor protein
MPDAEGRKSGSGPASLLDRLPPEFASKLLSERTVTLRQGETLFERGDAGNGCYLLRQGVVAITATSAKGDHRTLAILGPAALIGELAMIDGLPRSASVTALRDCSLSFISRAAFLAVVRQHPELHMEITATLAARLRQSDDEVIAASFLSMRARVARALLQFARHLGEPTDSGRVRIQHKVSQSDLAAMAGVARESVSRTLSMWHKAKILEETPRMSYLVDIGRLEREAAVVE